MANFIILTDERKNRVRINIDHIVRYCTCVEDENFSTFVNLIGFKLPLTVMEGVVTIDDMINAAMGACVYD